MSQRTYRWAVGTVLAAEAALLAWNAWRFDWLRGYDAFANDVYANVVATDSTVCCGGLTVSSPGGVLLQPAAGAMAAV